MAKKYKSNFQKNRLYYFLISLLLFNTIILEKLCASGAYDKGTATGKGRFELSITINPLGIIPYGQNYGVLSYGLSTKMDLVGYYSSHQNGTQSQYIGLFYQFLSTNRLDLATAIGFRNKNIGNWDIFCPQLLYTFKLANNFSIGGSLVRVLEGNTYKNRGDALDITFYSPINVIKKINPKIKEAYLGIGTFKNASAAIPKDKLYIHYSLDLIF